MKQLTNSHLKVVFDGIEASEIRQVDFVFSQTRMSKPSKMARYGPLPIHTGDVTLRDGVFYVPFTVVDTLSFKPDTTFYMDTHVWLIGTDDNPPTPIVPLRMDRTLFEYNDNNFDTAESGGETE